MGLLYFKSLPDPGACDLPLLIPAIMILLIPGFYVPESVK
jgi:hypothetical protein